MRSLASSRERTGWQRRDVGTASLRDAIACRKTVPAAREYAFRGRSYYLQPLVLLDTIPSTPEPDVGGPDGAERDMIDSFLHRALDAIESAIDTTASFSVMDAVKEIPGAVSGVIDSIESAIDGRLKASLPIGAVDTGARAASDHSFYGLSARQVR
jgi:hypothetical protein